MKRIVATLGERSYLITIASSLFNEPASLLPLKSGEQVMLVTSEILAPLYPDKVRGVLEQVGVNVDSVIPPDGEQYKSLAVLDTAPTALLQKSHGRGTILVALGGGVVGDLTGLATASYRRDVRSIQVPTTLLSQVNSSIGGKIAVNHSLGKSMIGASYQPASVAVDLDCLKTLPPRESASGLAEVIKYGIIPDGVFFNWLGENLDVLLRLDDPTMAYYIRRCCELRTEIVVADERKTGSRTLLNLGHTFGHAIEAEMGYGNWLRDEAVAAGMVMAVRASGRLGQFSSAETQRIITLFTRVGLPVNGPYEMSVRVYLPYMLRDKKVLTEEMRLIPPLAIGKSEVRSGVSHELVLNAIADCQLA